MCFKCGRQFSRLQGLQRHTRESCELVKPNEQYVSGAVQSSRLLLDQIKEIFDVPDDVLPRLIYSNCLFRGLVHITTREASWFDLFISAISS